MATEQGQRQNAELPPYPHDEENRTNACEENEESDELEEDDDDEDCFLLPIVPLEVAVVCCVLNFILPGIGTVIAGFSVLCCAKVDDLTRKQQANSFIVVVGVGFLQLLMVSCFLIGWIWSGIWGVSLINNSVEYYKPEGRGVPSHWRQGDNRRRLRPRSNLIYPMRARSNTQYNSPPPPYEMYSTPPPGYVVPGHVQEEINYSITHENHVFHENVGDTIVVSENNNLPVYWKCEVCQKQFTGLSGKCNRCIENVCQSCYQQTLTMPNREVVHVCDTCFRETSLEYDQT